MGSVAPRPSQYGAARNLMQLLLVHVRARGYGGEPDIEALKEILDAALDDPVSGEIIRYYLAAYLGRCLADSLPDHTVWEPWRLPG